MMYINQLEWGRTGPESIRIICALPTPQGGCPEPPGTRNIPPLHPRLWRTVPGAGLAEQTRAGFEEGKEQACLCSQLAPPFAQPFLTLTPSCCYLSGLGWDSLRSLSAELFNMAVGILAKQQD